MVEHVEEVRERMATIWPIVREHMAEAQTAQAQVYNRGAQPREFAPGDKVLVLVPTSECQFLAKWNGPYEVIEKVGTINYRVRQPGRRPPTKVYHVNLLKKWVAREVLFSLTPPQVAVKTEPVQVPMGEQLTPSQRQDLQDLVNWNRDVFSAEAGHTDLIQHRIVTEPGKWVKLRPYRIPEARREAIAAERSSSMPQCLGIMLRWFDSTDSRGLSLIRCCRLRQDPREWPADHQELASYGRDHLATVSEHFANVLDRMGCDQEKAQRVEWSSAKVPIKSLPQGLQRNAWQDFFLDDERRSSFPNLLLIVELILVLPLSTASVERGFSAMKRTKTYWRSNLSVHTVTRLLFISLEGPDMEHFNAMPVVKRWLKKADRRSLQ
ncbi:hypothetical protein SKAU_G00138880 [Synaphobranchus kaupii]|uniref:HAT C-terminal dimerisation domain-containing protein n=1 Tax=Synaphobranchus kaupii TaxID=118154 RepID=A0A9Q1J1Z0_SYNKA|nr:hypothetical protein SKAU_G00138880 [Synaphobranchus kaupii]